jgi:ribosomal protein S12 methylthiotransferase accessory factor YcaO
LPLENSNGWAAHIEKTDSENAAISELVERDAVLAHWYTCTPFSELNLNTIPLIKQWADKELINSEFPQLRILISSIGFAPTVTVLLANSDNYGVAGHSAKSNLFEAIESAIGEATRAAHLTLRRAYFSESKNIFIGNNTSNKNVDSGVHAVFYAYHTPFPNWMFGTKINLEEAKHLYQQAWTKFYFYQNSKFHVQTVMDYPLFVSFAARADIIPLRWGITDTQRIEEIRTLERFKNYKIINTDIHIVC